MRRQTIDKLCCPFDRSDLDLTVVTQDLQERVIEGFLTCSTCKRIYPMAQGIPIMNPDQYREFELERPLLEKFHKHLAGKKIENFRLGDSEKADPACRSAID